VGAFAIARSFAVSRRVSTCLTLGLALSFAAPAQAQEVDAATRSAARDLGYAGVNAYQAGDYTTASAKLEKAYAVLKAPSLGLWSARALAKLGKLVEASERYVDVTRLQVSGGDVAVHEQAKKDAASEHAALAPRVPKLLVRVTGVEEREVAVTIDGTPLANALIGEHSPVNPGTHTVSGKRGDETVEERISIAAGTEQSVELKFKGGPLPEATTGAASVDETRPVRGSDASDRYTVDPSTRSRRGSPALRTLGWIGLIAGGAAVAGGAATGIIVLDWRSQIDSDEEKARDPGTRNRYETLRTITLVSLISGGVLTTAGIVILAVTPSGGSANNDIGKGRFVAVEVGPGSLGVNGAF
jgi:hypothetical protein